MCLALKRGAHHSLRCIVRPSKKCVLLKRRAHFDPKLHWRLSAVHIFNTIPLSMVFGHSKQCAPLKRCARFRPKCVCRLSVVHTLLHVPFLTLKTVRLAPAPCTFPDLCSSEAIVAPLKPEFASRLSVVRKIDQNMPGVQAWCTIGARGCDAPHP